jgi:hypothetical protein
VNALRTAISSAVFAALSASAALAQTPPASPAPGPVPSPAASPGSMRPSMPSGLSLPQLMQNALGGGGGSPQPYATFIKGAERKSGLIDILGKDDEYYLDVTADQFDHPFIVAPVLASGVGGGAFAGRIYAPFLLEFQHVGKRILWVSKNPAFTAPAGTTFANALGISTTDSVIGSTPVLAEDEAKKHFVISAGFFLTDYENVGRDLGGGGGGGLQLLLGPPRPGFGLDASRSYIEKAKALPKNDEILSNLVFTGPPAGPSAATDGRGVRVRMHWSIAEPPSNTYVPRFADDRVGYFITSHKDFSNDSAASPIVRYIDRWNFNNGPIVYYLTNEIPAEYKPAIRRALLAWNGAFAKAGIPNAVEVRDQPNDPSWDPDDIRYSTVRWLTSDQPQFSAYGPNISDPRTGQVIRVEVVIDGEVARSVKRGYREQVVPTRRVASAATVPSDDRASIAAALTGYDAAQDPAAQACAGDCDDFMQESGDFASIGTLEQLGAGASPAQVQKYTEDWLYSVVLHEAGHNFGLRHNFASAIYPLAKLHDRAFTERNGLVSSVMNYTPVNLSPPGKPQGDYFQMRLGPYDYWAIQYGYQQFPGVTKPSDEAVRLKRIAEESTRPEYAYATDEDANGARAVDPGVAQFLLSSDRFEFYRNQFDVVDDLVGRLDRVFPRDDRPYYEETLAFLGMQRQYQRAAALAIRYIGGLYTSRSHRGQPGGAPPFRSVSRDDQRRAFSELAQHVFSSRAMRISPTLLSNLGPSNYSGRDASLFEDRPDFPLTDYVAELQNSAMFGLFSPVVLSRIADQQLRDAHPGASMSEADLFGWMEAAVWNDTGKSGSIDILQRALQRRWTDWLMAVSVAPSFIIDILGFPSDTVPLARYELRHLDGTLADAVRRGNLDVATRAHLEDLHERVHRTLDASMTRGGA